MKRNTLWGRAPRNLSQLAIKTWAWFLATLAFCLGASLCLRGLLLVDGARLTTAQVASIFVLFGVLWLVNAVLSLIFVIRYGRRQRFVNDVPTAFIAVYSIFLFVAGVSALDMGEVIGAGISTFVSGCLLLLNVLYIIVVLGVAERVRWYVYVCAAGIVVMIGLTWMGPV